jgi:hypothetical protein
VKERFAGVSVDVGGGTARQFADLVAQDIAKYRKLVRQLDIKTN